MTPKDFNPIITELLSDALRSYGFSMEESHCCTWHRRASEDLYHFILPDLGTRGAWYDIKVFATSPLLDPLFADRFPDALAIPSDSWSYLSDRGVGLDQQQFNCKNEENLRNRFASTVRPLLVDRAIPYLDVLKHIEDLAPLIRHPLPLGYALCHIGQVTEARSLLLAERQRLLLGNASDPAVVAHLQRIDSLLDPIP